MNYENFEIIKSSGKKVKFSLDKFRASLKRIGADLNTINFIVKKVREELYQGITTQEIYNRALVLLKQKQGLLASRYKLKTAIYELGPTGFPFEHFISAILNYSGYKTVLNKVLNGYCMSHEIDIIAEKDNKTTIIECKFHGEKGLNCNVKIPLYINSRYQDVKTYWNANQKKDSKLTKGWVVTNTRFTKDALQYGSCCGLYLLSWDYPENDGLKDRIDRLRLYPITVSTLLSSKEKHFLLDKNIVLCRDLHQHNFYLDHLGVSEIRKKKILKEISYLCNIDRH